MTNLSLVTQILRKLWQKILKIDDVKNSDSMYLFAIVDHVQQNLDHHWILRDELHRIDTFNMQKYQLKNLTFFT